MTIHRFWMGRLMPDEYMRYGEQWQILNPNEAVVDWDESAVLDFPDLAEVFEDLYARDAGRHGVELSVQIADVMGYALVERHGGTYVNCDMEPVRPMPKMPDRAWASYENLVDGRINNAAIGAPERHDPFWTALLRALPKNYFANRLDEMVMSTGPGFLTNFAGTAGLPLAVLPMTVFNSVHWKTILPGSNAAKIVRSAGYPSDAIAVHHWGHKKDGRSNKIETATQADWE